jgi:hypothetical protein
MVEALTMVHPTSLATEFQMILREDSGQFLPRLDEGKFIIMKLNEYAVTSVGHSDEASSKVSFKVPRSSEGQPSIEGIFLAHEPTVSNTITESKPADIFSDL